VKILWASLIWPPSWQLWAPTLVPQLPWVKNCQPSSELYCPPTTTGCFDHFIDTLRKLPGNKSYLLTKHNYSPRKHSPAVTISKQFVLEFLPSQASVNSRWPVPIFIQAIREHFLWWLSRRPVVDAHTFHHLHESLARFMQTPLS
jgi:hypothetical protein